MKKGLLIGIGVFGLILISIFSINSYSEKASKKTENNSEIEPVQDGGQKNVKASGNTITSNSKQPANVNSETTNSAPDEAANPAEIENLKNKYRAQFYQINSLADQKLEALIEEAKEEYKYKSERKEDLSTIKFKYNAIQEKYEQTTEIQFNSAYGELKREALDKKLLTSTIEEFNQIYLLKKNERYKKLQTELNTMIG
ncbi:hypothetical protein [Neobacillus citreus]|uniref:Uncharacterized protein n=1 Tax=Neobacillus citreus TaxID=2833578 RepID=A0A942T8G7_9BACI|nr:hypothetical protein [Neobacillus citreus]MCH6269403.1 hypothetical protein [Neobacillus citreus]